eukprot:jgi/Bigna1/40106/e_gw1.39.61.1
MKCKVSCSFGEIVDEVTILRIKKSKAKDKKAPLNVQRELATTTRQNPLVLDDNKLFVDLGTMNRKLWNLEDLTRDESRKKQFDSEHINCAELIHGTNDERHGVKQLINQKYNSHLKEEKMHH